MKIAFFDPYSMDFGGGVEHWINEVSNRLSARGHDVQIISLKYSPVLNLSFLETDNNSFYTEIPYAKLPLGSPFPAFSALSSVIKHFNAVDVVYFFPYPPNDLILSVLKRKLKLIHSPVIAGIHGFFRSDIALERFYTHFWKKCLGSFDAFHVLNRYASNLIKCMYSNVNFIPNGVNTKNFSLSNLNLDRFTVLFTGIHNKNKGIETLVNVIETINKSDFNNFKFIVTGMGDFTPMVTRLAKRYDNVEYLGYIPSDLMPKIYENSHLFFAPSKLEGMPLRILEAQSCGLPVVASNIPGINDVVIHKKTGLLSEVNDVLGFVRDIRNYYYFWKNSIEEYAKLNDEIRNVIIKNFDWNRIITALEKMFANVYTDFNDT